MKGFDKRVATYADYLKERAPGVSVEEIKRLTAGDLVIDGDVPEMKI